MIAAPFAFDVSFRCIVLVSGFVSRIANICIITFMFSTLLYFLPDYDKIKDEYFVFSKNSYYIHNLVIWLEGFIKDLQSDS